MTFSASAVWRDPLNRRRAWYLAATFAALWLGWTSRHISALSHGPMGKYPGDALWATMVFFGWGGLFPERPVRSIAMYALTMCCIVEVLKLYQAPWIVGIRSTALGRLVFGYAFSWTNLVMYILGITAGVALAIVCRSSSSAPR